MLRTVQLSTELLPFNTMLAVFNWRQRALALRSLMRPCDMEADSAVGFSRASLALQQPFCIPCADDCRVND